MTKDDAIKVMSVIWGGHPQHDLAIRYVDAFVALGMLKLEGSSSAIAEECAKIAYGHVAMWSKTGEADFNRGYDEACRDIAEAIRDAYGART
jgi:hypothetical protein